MASLWRVTRRRDAKVGEVARATTSVTPWPLEHITPTSVALLLFLEQFLLNCRRDLSRANQPEPTVHDVLGSGHVCAKWTGKHSGHCTDFFLVPVSAERNRLLPGVVTGLGGQSCHSFGSGNRSWDQGV